MEYLTLKNSDLKVSRLCMGGCPMGEYGWGDVQQQELLDAVNAAVDNGINFFDTADTYGLGKSEENLAKALGEKRKQVVIATKFGVRVENGKTFYDNSKEWIETAVVNSLRRLKTDYIDLYQIHYLDGKTPIAEIVETLDGLKKKGYIRYYGLSNIYANMVDEIAPYAGKFASMQDEYSLACRKNEKELIKTTSKLEVTPMTWGSLAQGILTGKYDKNTVFAENDRRNRDIYVNFHGEKLAKNLEIVEQMKVVAQNHGVSVAAVAVRFILDHIQDSVVLVGAKRPSQILGSIESMSWTLTAKEHNLLNEISK